MRGEKYSFNIKTFFLQFFYLGYRRMYRYFFMFFLLSVVIDIIFRGFISGLFFESVDYQTSYAIGRLLNFLFMLTLAGLSNKLYIEESIRDIIKIKEHTLDHEEQLRLAAVKGGVNWAVPFVMLVPVLLYLAWLTNYITLP